MQKLSALWCLPVSFIVICFLRLLMVFKKQYCFPFLSLLIFIAACNSKSGRLFTALHSDESGIDFINSIDENQLPKESLNEFAYMGGGVGIIDVNNDGLKDIFFSGNQVNCRLYLNKGGNHFEDITKSAGIATDVWCTGVSIADINADGFDDIYVCTYGRNLAERAKNLLFINQHNNSFKEEAGVYGLADSSYSSQAVFFDYDKDGDLDVYIANYLMNASYSANYLFPKNLTGSSPANDRLYRNDGDSAGKGHPVFTDVTKQAGIIDDGFGLGVSVSDYNNDGWPDIYVSNDFISNDFFWLNNKNGSFTNVLDRSTRHQSYSSMGMDAADINNDKLVDFITVDMMPEDNERRKLMYSFMNYDRYQAERGLGYSPEFMRNTLQLNNGNYYAKDTAIPFFSDIGQMAGISETDWSWSVLIADYNNDGYKDIHITNGIGRDFLNSDFIAFSKAVNQQSTDEKAMRQLLKDKLVALKSVELPNYLYLNNGGYTFSNISDSAGINEPAVSNGAAYADLDNDGDLDLVVNNVNKKAFVFINNTMQAGAGHNISFSLKGDAQNPKGVGAKVYIYHKQEVQMQEEYPVRGYLSTVDDRLIFGTGVNTVIDSAVVIWPDAAKQVMHNLAADSSYVIMKTDAAQQPSLLSNAANYIFTDASEESTIQYKHTDVEFYDYGTQILLPQKFSQLGPFISTGDINKDGKTDFYIGGAFNFSGMLFKQQQDAKFQSSKFTDTIKFREDMQSVLFDADNDGDADLLVTYGDMRFADTSVYYKPRLYLNDGNGNFMLNGVAIPDSVRTIAGCVTVGDYDNDGDEDVFIGGRVSKRYPLSPRSFILQNNKGIFTDVTTTVSAELQYAGMVTAAAFTDFNNDHKPDLVIAGEYMPVRFFANSNKQLKEVTTSTVPDNMNGMWRSLIAADIDNDGDIDFVAGNLGLNCRYHISATEPMKLFAKDMDGNGTIEPLMFYYIKDKHGKRELYPAISRDMLVQQVPVMKKSFLQYSDYAKAGFDEIYKGNKEGLQTFTCTETRSCWLENTGGKFIMHALPAEAQFAPVNAIVCTDVDGDNINDLLLAGNEYQAEVNTGRYDASYGCYLKGTGNGNFTAISPASSGFIVNGDVKDMKLITTANNQRLLLVAVNNDSLRVLKIK